MSERCPLISGELRVEGRDDVPEFCQKNCGVLWDKAVRGKAEHDWYGASTKDCNHEEHEVEFSHYSLFKPDDTPARKYVIVDLCTGCRTELMETSYAYECPHN
jgi:hypothetical protein